MEEIKQQATPRSFRITDDVMGKFKEIQDEMKLTQDSALKMLVGAYEIEKAKSAIPDRETEIANFQAKTNELVEAFLHSLQLNQDAESRARSAVALQLKSKDETIIDLQGKIETLKAKHEDLMTEAKESKEKLSEALKNAQSAQKEAERAEASLSTANALVDAKNTEIERLTVEAASVPGIKKEIEALKDINSSLQKEKEDLSRTVADLQREIEATKKEAERDLQITKKEAAAEIRSAVAEAKEEAQKKIDAYVDKLEVKDEEIARLQREIMNLKLAAQNADEKELY